MMIRAPHLLVVLSVLAGIAGPAAAGGKVVVELFTSQGCSSCPPADAYLADLARRDDVIALSFHVDYWNYIGWTDPFSSPAATARQRAYGHTLGRAYVYTPQMVVDGRAEAVGSDRGTVGSLIRMAAAAQKVGVEMALRPDGTGARLRLPATAGAAAEIWVVFFDDAHATEVAAGENRGATLRNAHVVRGFRQVGVWTGAALERTLDLRALGSAGRDGCVVLLQAANGGPILGAAVLALPHRRS